MTERQVADDLGLSVEPLLRGSPERLTNFMEQHQAAFINAVAASTGCVVQSGNVDIGEDLILIHESAAHQAMADDTARLSIQMKATSSPRNLQSDHVAARLSHAGYKQFIKSGANMQHKIVAIMEVPADWDDWINQLDEGLLLKRNVYWVNIAGFPKREEKEIIVKAPRDQLLNSRTLCDMMTRIGKGEKP